MFSFFKRVKKQDIMQVLNEINDPNIDPFANLGHIRELCEKDSDLVTKTLLQALESEDDLQRAHAARALAFLPTKDSPAVQDAFVEHLKSDSSYIVRNRCSYGLVNIKQTAPHSPKVLEAYIQASKDDNEIVSHMACWQLGYMAGPEAIEALVEATSHPLWLVRLEASKQLILLKKVDANVLATLEALLQDPKAQEYDASMDELESWNQKFIEEYPEHAQHLEEEDSWGKMQDILNRVRGVAV